MVGILEHMGGSTPVSRSARGDVAPLVSDTYTVATSKCQRDTDMGRRTCGEGKIGVVLVESVGSGTGNILVVVVHIGKTGTHVEREGIQLQHGMEEPVVETIRDTALDIKPQEIAKAYTGIA